MSSDVAELERPVDAVPEGWRIIRLGDVSRSFAGGTPSRSNPAFYGSGIPWLKSGEVRAGRIFDVEEQITEAGLRGSSARIAKAGSPVIAMYGATAGVAGILEIDAALNQAVLAIEPEEATLDREFCFHLLSSEAPRLLTMTQGSGQPNLSKGLIDGLNVALPPLDEQRRIAEVLRSVDEAITAADLASEAARHVFASVRAELLEHARATCAEVVVADAIAKNRGQKITKLQTADYLDDGAFPIIDQGASFICGFTNDATALWPYDLPVIVFGDHTRILKFVDFPFVIGADGTQCITPAAGFDALYLYYALQSLDLRGEGYARHFKLLKEKYIPMPTLAEQVEIAEQLVSLEHAIDEAATVTERLLTLKRALMSDLLSGRVRVPV